MSVGKKTTRGCPKANIFGQSMTSLTRCPTKLTRRRNIITIPYSIDDQFGVHGTVGCFWKSLVARTRRDNARFVQAYWSEGC